MKLIAFDSGLERTGWAVFEKPDKLLTYGCMFTDKKDPIEKRLAHLKKQTEELVKKNTPVQFVLEQLFFFSNQKTVIQVAQAQGVVMGIAGEHNIPCTFLTPPQIKSAVTGYGTSDKKNVQKMVGLLLHLDPMPTPDDTVDAIACGIAYCTINKHDW